MKLLAILVALVFSILTTNAAEKPNILWLVAEDFGPHLGSYGTKEVFTPNLDRLAAEGVRYTRFYTTAPVCSPSRSAWMTGMYQTTIGAHNHRSHRDDNYQLPAGVKVFTEWMREAGYRSLNLRQMPQGFGFRGTGKTDWNFNINYEPFDGTNWTDLKGEKPFFAQINFQETHRKFNAPKRADPAKVEVPPYYPEHPLVREDWAQYLDAATELDRKIGLILQRLQTDGLLEKTVIVFFGDNGEAHVRGKQFCYESGLHVPLIIRWPKDFPAPKHFNARNVDTRLLEAIDLAPTMLAIAGAAKPAAMQGAPFLGEKVAAPKEYVFGARDRCDETVFRFRTVRDRQYRYILNFTPDRPLLQPNEYKERQYPVWNLIKSLHSENKLNATQAVLAAPTMPAEELYDLEADPHETRNLANTPQHTETQKRLRTVLEKWIQETNDQGQQLEPAELAAAKGATKKATNPNAGYTLDGRAVGGAAPTKPETK